ncbi:MAG: phosphoenolpyruvate--protein phosphotransferase [Bacillota bacterium]|nr:phosphoenolpyruvate--protein phosphotransferase [Bacillota bacterium]
MAGLRLRGVAGSPGVALGPAFVFAPAARAAGGGAEAEVQASAAPEAEVARWLEARARLEAAYDRLVERAREAAGRGAAGAAAAEEGLAILEAQRMMVDDPGLEQAVREAVAAGKRAEAATREAVDRYAALFAGLEDAYLRQRAEDVREIGEAMLRALAGEEPIPLADLPPGSILCAPELGAGALLALDREALAGLALGSGGPTSHVAILARSMGVPAVLGLGDFLDEVRQGARVAVDGEAGELWVEPAGEELERLARAERRARAEREELAGLAGQPAVTPDGLRVELVANIGGPGDVEPALEAGAEGVGLFRTEFLVTGRETLPGEAEQAEVYRRVLEAMGGRPVIFRTFDIGGDKPVPALHLPQEANPFLGYRAIRIGLDHPDLLRTQLRAVLRAAAEAAPGGKGGAAGRGGTGPAESPARIMLPMVATLEEVRRARRLLEEARGELVARGLFPEGLRVPLGIMVEVPAAALIARRLAREVDFFSIGSNDLIQYTLAADRTDERVAGLYQPFHPAVLRLIGLCGEAAEEAGIPCGICGEMGGDPRATALLLGLGVRELSMTAASLARVKREVRRTPLARARELARQALACATAAEVEELVRAFREGWTAAGAAGGADAP